MTEQQRIAVLEAQVAAQEQNVNRLITEVERLVDEIARRPSQIASDHPVVEASPDAAPETRFRWKVPLVVLAILFAVFGVVFFAASRLGMVLETTSAHSGTNTVSSPLAQARLYENQRDYPRAEAAYRQVLTQEPNNTDAIRHLASVLFRQDKLTESAEALNGPKAKK